MAKVIVRPVYMAFERSSEIGIVGDFTIEMEVKPGCELPLCEDIYCKTQNLDANGWLNNAVEAGIFVPEEDKVKVINGHRSMRSMSADDALIVMFSESDTSYFICAYDGFEEVSEKMYVNHIKKMKARARARGFG